MKNLIESKRILTLELQDLATSANPLEACLERAGYNLKKQAELKASIAHKSTVDMFGRIDELNGEERTYQDAVGKCLIKLKGAC